MYGIPAPCCATLTSHPTEEGHLPAADARDERHVSESHSMMWGIWTSRSRRPSAAKLRKRCSSPACHGADRGRVSAKTMPGPHLRTRVAGRSRASQILRVTPYLAAVASRAINMANALPRTGSRIRHGCATRAWPRWCSPLELQCGVKATLRTAHSRWDNLSRRPYVAGVARGRRTSSRVLASKRSSRRS